MRLAKRAPLRGAFTLIELLVVVSILAMLAALTIGIIGSVRSGQNAATTDGTVKKAQLELDQQLKTVSEEASSVKNQYLPMAMSFCDGDADRAKSLLFYLYAKREFPQTFVEARNPLAIPGVGSIPGHKAFADLPLASGLTPDQEAAVLLYRIVLTKGNKGTSSSEDAFAGAVTTIGAHKAFKDGYGTHIAFVRWYSPYNGAYYSANADLQAAPFIAHPTLRDPFDRQGKLQNWGNTTNRNLCLGVLHNPAGSPTVAFDGFNKVLTVVSAGPDKTFNTADDVYGFRLNQLGGKAN